MQAAPGRSTRGHIAGGLQRQGLSGWGLPVGVLRFMGQTSVNAPQQRATADNP